ncbi:MAG: DnaD domain protein [Clostridiales bacterium]|nr:DnaD domain protein [Clostridiales bacterium]
MPPSNIRLKKTGVTALRNEAVDRIIEMAKPDAAILWLYLERLNGVFDLTSAGVLLQMDQSRIEDALSTLKDAGIIDGPIHFSDKVPDYTAEELANNRKDPIFSELCMALESALGRILKKSELLTLLDIYKRLSLSCGTILMLIQYLGKTPEKRLTMKELEREACRWADAGITTEEKAEEHLKTLIKKRLDMNEVMKIMKLFDRLPSPSEEKYINAWLSMGFTPDIIEIAYDKTVLNTGGLTWKYLNKILEIWHSKNIHTLSDIEREEQKTKRNNYKKYEIPASAEADEESLNRVKNYLRERKGGS